MQAHALVPSTLLPPPPSARACVTLVSNFGLSTRKSARGGLGWHERQQGPAIDVGRRRQRTAEDGGGLTLTKQERVCALVASRALQRCSYSVAVSD